MTNAEFRDWLEKRTTSFAIEVFKFMRKLPNDVSTKVISYQLGKCASSIGANYREANRAESKTDFTHKLAIALKEANETTYWIEVLSGLSGCGGEIALLNKESLEIRNLLQRIVSSSKKNPTQKLPNNSRTHKLTTQKLPIK